MAVNRFILIWKNYADLCEKADASEKSVEHGSAPPVKEDVDYTLKTVAQISDGILAAFPRADLEAHVVDPFSDLEDDIMIYRKDDPASDGIWEEFLEHPELYDTDEAESRIWIFRELGLKLEDTVSGSLIISLSYDPFDDETWAWKINGLDVSCDQLSKFLLDLSRKFPKIEFEAVVTEPRENPLAAFRICDGRMHSVICENKPDEGRG